jgi:hypothetical protein
MPNVLAVSETPGGLETAHRAFGIRLHRIGDGMNRKQKYGMILLLAAGVLVSAPASCETVTYTCQYESYSNEKGLHKVQDEFKLVFIVDPVKGTAQQLTDRGKFDVEMMPALDGGMTLVEMIGGGKLLATSIDKSGRSAHSRNIILEGQIAPSQYYGRCSQR